MVSKNWQGEKGQSQKNHGKKCKKRRKKEK